MAHEDDTSSLNNNNMASSDSSDDDDENSTVHETAIVIEESTDSSQPITDMVADGTGEIIDQLTIRESSHSASSRYTILPSRCCGLDVYSLEYWLMTILMGLTIGHSLYWFISVLIGLCIRCVAAIRFPVWRYDERFRVRLGQTQPWPSDYTLGLHHGGQEADRIAQTSDALQPMTIIYTFSTTITESFFPLVQESEVTEDGQPHTMPATVAGNYIAPNRIINDENSQFNTDETTQNNRNEMTIQAVNTEANIQTSVVGAGATGTPDELLQDFDFPDITNEHQNRNELDTSSDDERLLPDSYSYVDSDEDDNDVISNSDHRGETSPNTETITDGIEHDSPPNQMDVTDEQSGAGALSSGAESLPPQIPNIERGGGAPTEGVPQWLLPDVNPMIINGRKVPTPDNSSDESAKRSMSK